jgi:hypothetical protein
LQRLQQHLNTLRASKAQSGKKTARPQRKVPVPPPHLVASVIEALVASKFRDVVHIVDGEADVYCAALVLKQGGVILTSDSDLVLYDLGTAGSVVYFDALQNQLGDSTTQLQAPGYHPATVAKSLRLCSLLPLGYQVKRDPVRPFNASVSAARDNSLLDSPEYESFAEQYNVRTPALTGPTHLHSRLSCEFANSLSVLDPRISEFVVASLGARESESDINMYLPPLKDDPDRSAAWIVGSATRLLAYSILLSETAHGLVMEFFRRGPRIAADPLHTLSQSSIISSVEALLNVWNSLVMAFPGKPASELWRFLGLYILYSHLLEQEKPVPDVAEGTRLLRGEHPGRDWAHVHLKAEFEAAIYSVRILQQCSIVFLGLRSGDAEPSLVVEAVRKLHASLREQPGLADLYPDPQNAQNPGICANSVRAVRELLKIDSKPPKPEPSGGAKKHWRKRRKEKEAALKSEAESLPKSSSQSNNMYSLLSDGI